jgi:hypothetical protein
MKLFTKKKAAGWAEGLDAETAARHEALYLRINEVGGVEHLGDLELQDIAEAITLCEILTRTMKHSTLMCLEKFLRRLCPAGDKARIDQAIREYGKFSSVAAESLRAWRGTDPATGQPIVDIGHVKRLIDEVGIALEKPGAIQAGPSRPTKE